MARIRKITIKNYRSIKHFEWYPRQGTNCLIGPGDSGKTTILSAIELCFGTKRPMTIFDADFHNLNYEEPIEIECLLGDLDPTLLDFDTYGLYLMGYYDVLDTIEPEPADGLETVLNLKVRVGSDLEPIWTIASPRSDEQGQIRYFGWAERMRVAPAKIDHVGDQALSWKKGSILTKLSDETVNASAALLAAARDARTQFGDEAEDKLATALAIVQETAQTLGISIGEKARALLEASGGSSGATVSLHSAQGVPLRNLGLGSGRLLMAGLQREAANSAAMLLVDEVEHGLEPHRIIRFIGSLGAKDSDPKTQVFMTTHSPVALRELSANQLHVIRRNDEGHHVAKFLSSGDQDAQGTIRAFPEAFLARSVLVCEGASEIGFIRGIDLIRTSNGKSSLAAAGVALVDANGISKVHKRALTFHSLDYRVAVFRDSDAAPDERLFAQFTEKGLIDFFWRTGMAIEDELFQGASPTVALSMLYYAISLHGDDRVNANISSASNGGMKVGDCLQNIDGEKLQTLGNAARSGGWFKNVTAMEHVGSQIVGPNIKEMSSSVRSMVKNIFTWIQDAD